MNKKIFRFWVQIHLWLGLILGLVLALISLSGALLAVSESLLRLQYPDVLFPAGIDRDYMKMSTAEDLPVDEWVKRAQSMYPQLHSAEVIASPGSVPYPVDVVMLAGEMAPELAAGEELHVIVAFDPVAGTPIGSVVLEDTFVGNLLSFHATLLAGTSGVILVTVTGFVALISMLTGLYLWWPRGRSAWRNALKLRTQLTGRAWLISLHSVPAVWLFVPLFVILLSGSYLISPGPYKAVVSLAGELREFDAYETVPTDPSSCLPSVTREEAVSAALEVHPGQALRILITPTNPCLPYIVGLMPIGTSETRAAHTEVWVDQVSGEILNKRRSDDLSAPEVFVSWMAPLHADLGIGGFGTVLVTLTGLLVPAMFVTGLLAWLRQRKQRQRTLVRRQAEVNNL